MKNLYTAKARSVGGRAGHVETDDARLAFDLTPFTSKTGTNPEQLFACGYAACFGSAVHAVAVKENINPGEIIVEVTVNINEDDKGGFYLAAAINASLPGIDHAAAERIVQKAHQVCPYSKATRGNIEVKLSVDNHPLAQAA